MAKPDPATLTMRTSSTVGERELEKGSKNKSENGQKLKLKKCKKQPGQKNAWKNGWTSNVLSAGG